MAEVLGIIGGAIALCQACELSLKSVRFIRLVRKAQEDFMRVRNEVTTTAAFLSEARDVANALSGTSNSDFFSVNSTLSELKQELENLNTVLLTLKAPKGSVNASNSFPNMLKMRWAKEAFNIAAICSRIRQKRLEIMTVLAVYSSQKQYELLIEFQSVSTARFDSMDNSYKRIENVQEQTTESINNLASAAATREEDLTDIKQAHQGNDDSLQQLIAQSQTRTIPTCNDRKMSSDYALYHFKPLRKCKVICKCRCHEATSARSPGILSKALGQVLVSYNVIPIWGNRNCNSKTCARPSDEKSFLITYMFPHWILRSAISVHLSWSSLRGTGASLHLAIPRVISGRHGGWTAIRYENIKHLQYQISSKVLLPTDMLEWGESLLLYSARQSSSTSFEFMLEMCPKSAFWWTDSFGRSVVSSIYRGIALGRLNDTMSFVKRVKQLTDDVNTSTTIIDVVVGQAESDISLQNAIDMNPSSLNVRDIGGLTAVHWAVIKRNLLFLKVLVANGVDLNISDFEGWTPLHHAVVLGELTITEYLIKAGSDINAVTAWIDTPLHLAARGHYCSIVQLLISQGVNVHAVNRHGRTAIAMPMILENNEMLIPTLQALLDAGLDINHGDNEKRRAIHEAVQLNNPAFIEALHHFKADFAVKERFQRNFLHLTAMFGNLDTINTLRKLEVCCTDHNAPDASGETAIEVFEKCIKKPITELWSDQRKPTDEEIHSFYSLMKEIQKRHSNTQ